MKIALVVLGLAVVALFAQDWLSEPRLYYYEP